VVAGTGSEQGGGARQRKQARVRKAVPKGAVDRRTEDAGKSQPRILQGKVGGRKKSAYARTQTVKDEEGNLPRKKGLA